MFGGKKDAAAVLLLVAPTQRLDVDNTLVGVVVGRVILVLFATVVVVVVVVVLFEFTGQNVICSLLLLFFISATAAVVRVVVEYHLHLVMVVDLLAHGHGQAHGGHTLRTLLVVVQVQHQIGHILRLHLLFYWPLMPLLL